MKEYKLRSWPDLPPEFRRMAFRRLLSEMSQRHVPESMLLHRDGVKTSEVRSLLQFLAEYGLVDARKAPFSTARWRPALASWLRRITP